MKREAFIRVRKLNKDEKGLTLLEYAAGASFVLVIATLVFTALRLGMVNYFDGIGRWLTEATTELDQNLPDTDGDGN